MIIPHSFFTWHNVPRYLFFPSVAFSMFLGLGLFNLSKFMRKYSKNFKDILISVIISFIIVMHILLVNLDEAKFEFQGEESRKIIQDLDNISPLLKDNSKLYFDQSYFNCFHLRKGIEFFFDVKNITLLCNSNQLNLYENSDEFIRIGYKDSLIQEI